MSNVLQYKGYAARIEVSIEDQILYGKIEGIADLIDFEADSFENIENEFHAAVDDYLDFCESVGKQPEKEFKGSFNVRMDPNLHRDLFMLSVKHDTSLNQEVINACQSYYAQAHFKDAMSESFKAFAACNSAPAVAQTIPHGLYSSMRTVSSSNPTMMN